MPTTYRKKQLFEDASKENGVYPVTVTDAVFDSNGTSLDNLLRGNVTTCILPAFSAAGTQNVAVTGITVDSNPTLDIYIPTAADLPTSAVDWAHIYRADTYDGGITFYSDGIVTGGETIIIKGY